jgi:transcriptional regulator with XRE-family HTH domain
LTLKAISTEIGFTTSQWNNYELGLSFPKFLDLIKISDYFKIPETDLIHKDLELNATTFVEIKKNQKEIISLQNKLIKIQEEKIIQLEKELFFLKKTSKL